MRVPKRRLKRRDYLLHAERLGVETLEQRVVLDGSAGPEPAGELFTIGSDLPTPTATAQFGDFTYEVINSQVTITDYPTSATGVIVIPAEIERLPVTSIGDYAFSRCVSLASITIPDSVTHIGNYAFYSCVSLTSITIPSSVTSIGYFTFSYCSSLTSITIPDGVTSIAYGAFRDCISLTSIAIPDSVTHIGDYAFYNCLSLTSITIPDSVASIGYDAFHYCRSLTSITIPNSVTSIGSVAFADCTRLTSITFDGAPPFVGASGFSGTPATIYHYADVTGWGATYGGRPTVALAARRTPGIPTGLAALPWNTQVRLSWVAPSTYGGASLADYVIEYSSDAGQTWGTFDDGTSTETSVTVTGLTNGTSYLFRVAAVNDAGRGEFSEPSEAVAPTATATYGNFTYLVSNGEVTITDYPTTTAGAVVIPVEIEGLPVTSIGSFAFYRCSSLTSITIPDGVTSIGLAAFQYCTSLTNITIPNSVASIGESAFYGCTSLTSVTIPDSVTSIENQAFRDCTSLTSITIGRGVTSIRNDTFHYCLSLISVTIPDSVTSIGHRGFYNCTSLTSIAIPNGVTSIGYEAFFQCSNLTSVTFDGTPPTLGTSVFSGTSAMIYYYADAPGWGVTYGGRPTVALAVQQVPGIPAGLVAVPGNTQASLSWSAPSSDGGSPITDYVIQYSSDGGDSWATFDDSVSAKTNVTVTGLTNNLGYVFRVAAVNDAGQGELSAPSEAVTPVLPDAVFSVPSGAKITLPNWAGENRIVKQGLGTLILDTANTHTGGILVDEGTIIIRDAEALGAGALQVGPGAKVVLDAGDEVIRAAGLGMDATANLELGLNRLVVAAGGWSATEIRDRVIGGRNGGLWDGTGISSGMVTGISNRAIGYITNASGDLEISWAALGDANLDYKVDAFDLVSVASGNAYLQAADANWQTGDFNYDNRSDAFDLIQMLSTLLYNQGSYLPAQPAPKPVLQADAMMVFAALAMEDAAEEE